MNKKIIYISLLIIISLLALVVGVYHYKLSQGPVDYNGVYKTDFKLKEDIQINFDRFGTPHIKAKQQKDAFYALGFVQASERLFQMDLLRRLGRGRLSELFGEKAIEVDKLFSSLSFVHFFKKSHKLRPLPKELRINLESYFAGVNDYIAKGNLPIEYTLLQAQCDEFDLYDAYAMVGYMAYSFAMGIKTDLLYQEILDEHSLEIVNKIRARPVAPKAKRVVKNKVLKNELKRFHYANSWAQNLVGFFEGSNGWVLNGSRSASGAPILANDPHVQLGIPGLWYEAVIDWGDSPRYGHFVPLLPFPALMHSEEIAWGLTISYLDDMDFYQEKVQQKANGKKEILYKNKWRELEVIKKKIIVKGQKPVEHSIYIGPHGPLLTDLTINKKKIKKAISLKWGHHHKENRALWALYKMMMSKNMAEFQNALSFGRSPGLNVIYADQSNNIARFIFGTQYERPNDMNGDLVYDGSSGHYDDLYFVDFNKRAHLINPSSGMIVSANQSPESTDITGYFQPMDRYDTIHAILQQKKKWSVEELKFVQTSSSNLKSIGIKKIITRAIEKINLNEIEKKAFHLLKNWDGISSKESAGALVYHHIFYELEYLLAPKEIKDKVGKLSELTSYWHFLERQILRSENEKKLQKAYRLAVEKLSRNYGAVNRWQWQSAHRIEFSHPLSLGSKVAGWLLNFGEFGVSGAYNGINNLRRHGRTDDFNVKIGPSVRRLIDLSNPNEALMVMPMGNSGHLKSEFYKNQWPLFEKGEYRKAHLILAKENIYKKMILKN